MLKIRLGETPPVMPRSHGRFWEPNADVDEPNTVLIPESVIACSPLA